MESFLHGFLCLLLLASVAGAQEKKAAGLPPLIDRELIFGNPEIAAAELSPNGQYIAFLKPWKDTRNVYVKAVGEPFSAARLPRGSPIPSAWAFLAAPMAATLPWPELPLRPTCMRRRWTSLDRRI
jgi:hypothetical protein